jgi:hypothetical protein
MCSRVKGTAAPVVPSLVLVPSPVLLVLVPGSSLVVPVVLAGAVVVASVVLVPVPVVWPSLTLPALVVGSGVVVVAALPVAGAAVVPVVLLVLLEPSVVAPRPGSAPQARSSCSSNEAATAGDVRGCIGAASHGRARRGRGPWRRYLSSLSSVGVKARLAELMQ